MSVSQTKRRARRVQGAPPNIKGVQDRSSRVNPRYVVVPIVHESDRSAAWALAAGVYLGGVASSSALALYRGVTQRAARSCIERAVLRGWVDAYHGRYRVTGSGRQVWGTMRKAVVPVEVARAGLTGIQMTVWWRIRQDASRRKTYGARTLARWLDCSASAVWRALLRLRSLGLLHVMDAFGRFKTPRRHASRLRWPGSEVLTTSKNPSPTDERRTTPRVPSGTPWRSPRRPEFAGSGPALTAGRPSPQRPLIRDLLKVVLELGL